MWNTFVILLLTSIPQITQIDADLRANEEEEVGGLYRGRYVEPDRISSKEANTRHKVIYCVATLAPQIMQINADLLI